MAGRGGALCVSAAGHGGEFSFPFQVWQPGLEAAGNRLSGAFPASRKSFSHWHVYLLDDKKSDHRRRSHVWRLHNPLGARVGQRL